MGAAAAAGPHCADAQALPHLVVGTAPIDAGMPAVIGQKAGIFRRNGLDVDVQIMNSGAAVSAAIVGGAMQAGGTSVMGLITAHLKGVPFQIIAPASLYLSDKPSELLVVRKDSPIRTGADMNGKTVASSLRCATYFRSRCTRGSIRTAAIRAPCARSNFRPPRHRPRSTPAASTPRC